MESGLLMAALILTLALPKQAREGEAADTVVLNEVLDAAGLAQTSISERKRGMVSGRPQVLSRFGLSPIPALAWHR